MVEVLTPDICVIGAGSGGLSVAAAAAAFGVPVVLVERGKMGGECLNAGCVPSKSLIAAARHAHAFAGLGRFGLSAQGLEIDFAGVHRHVHEVIAAIAPNDSSARFTGLGVRVIAAAARFADRDTVMAGEEIAIKARRFVIATGSSPAMPPVTGVKEIPYLTNETVFDLTQRPAHLIVIGAGPMGLELAQAFRRLGSAVTVLEAGRPLAREDPECAQVVLDALAREGVELRTGIAIARVQQSGAEVHVIVRGQGQQTTIAETTEETIAGSHLLLATGRRANVEGLGLDAAGIRYDRSGIAVDRGLKTSNRRVYAIGDVIGGAQFTHLANHHAALVIRNALFRLPVRTHDHIVPRVTFTDPELAHVGMTEREARESGVVFRVLRWPFHENDRAQAERATAGHIKVVTARNGRILGATIAGPAAGELIVPWILAVTRRLNVRAFAGMIFPYPTLAEVGKRAALSYFTPALRSPFVRGMIRFLRRFG